VDRDDHASVDTRGPVMSSAVLGVDIGGSHVKAAPVDTFDGELIEPRERVVTPSPGTPEQLVGSIGELVDRFRWSGPMGVAFPGVVEHGVVRTTAHLDPSWVGVDLPAMLDAEFGGPVTALNDADAAGLAEVRFGAAFGHLGVVVVVTLGTGVGTGLFNDGTLVANAELGHIPLHGDDMDDIVSARARAADDESWDEWGRDLDRYLGLLERLLWPSLFVIGGGVSKKFDRFEHLLRTRTGVVPARLANEAGIVGSALYHREQNPRPCAMA
jgi:polyphosphate glucokinase